jgi:hypothetical protein
MPFAIHLRRIHFPHVTPRHADLCSSSIEAVFRLLPHLLFPVMQSKCTPRNISALVLMKDDHIIIPPEGRCISLFLRHLPFPVMQSKCTPRNISALGLMKEDPIIRRPGGRCIPLFLRHPSFIGLHSSPLIPLNNDMTRPRVIP